jgi:hypothetical protein
MQVAATLPHVLPPGRASASFALFALFAVPLPVA